MARRKRDSFAEQDDGRTIVSMNAEGMPWYTPKREEANPSPQEPMTRRELMFFTWGALKAALLVVGVLCVGLVLFVLFCQFIWFK